ncbi:hypothetical protein GRI40_10465 [Altererythrobacter aerius]|uniref:Uncharacterized protein n=1 Tax=Tsuneonella aeria TaxID=1837929 RepID=A0A6I4TDH1_9SPHN|nr:hypothetical protein [Tsuneonella aeria]MXO75639.1 hypothetical protein [Tsuneonella aeria]
MRAKRILNLWFALAFVAITLLIAAVLVGTADNRGLLSETAAGPDRPEAASKDAPPSSSEGTIRDTASPEVFPVSDEELIDPATGIEPTPIDPEPAGIEPAPMLPEDGMATGFSNGDPQDAGADPRG